MKEVTKRFIEQITKKFVALPDDEKLLVAGYIIAKDEERSRKEKEAESKKTA